MTALQLRRLGQSPRLREPQNVRVGFLQQSASNFSEALVAPSSRRDPGAGVDNDEKHIRGNAKPREVRPSRSHLGMCVKEAVKARVQRLPCCLQQMHPNVSAMRAGQIRRDSVGQKRTTAANTVPDSSTRTTQPKYKVVTNVHACRKGPVESALP